MNRMSRVARRLAPALAFSLLSAPTQAGTVAPAASAFSLSHVGEVDSGVLSVLGTFTSTRASAAPTLHFPKFDPSVGRLTGVAVAVNTSASTFRVAPSGLLSLISFASASRSLAYRVTAGSTTASDGDTRVDAGAALLTLLGLGSADIGGVPLAKTTTFTAAAALADFVGAGSVAVDLTATDTLSVSTLLSLLNGAGFTASGQASGTVAMTYTYAPYPGNGQLSMDKTASVSNAARGDTITYTLVFTNEGVSPIDGLAIQDATPPFTTYLSSRVLVVPDGLSVSGETAPAVGDSGPLAWNFAGSLAPGATGTLQYSVVVN